MLIHWIWLATRESLNDREKRMLLEHFRDPENLFYADAADLIAIDGLSDDARQSLADKNLVSAEAVLAQCAGEKIHILTYQDAAYPARLKNISDPPLVLYYKGILPDLDNSPVIGVVGTRKASLYGLTCAKRMGYQIGKCGGILVSGMAHGIDGVAMQGALTAGRPVVGILGCGVDVVYPPSNRALYADMERHGCLISEFLPGTPPLRWNFPKRNRIISGMSDGVLVVEAPEKSGALITARQALEQGRDVFAVPGNIDVPTFAGCNALLRDGAILAQSGWDVVSEYRHLYPDKVRKDTAPAKQTASPEELVREQAKVAQKPVLPRNKENDGGKKPEKVIDKPDSSAYSDGKDAFAALTEEERIIVDQLRGGEKLVDDVIAAAGMPSGKVLAMLTMLEVRGIVTVKPGRRVCLKTK